MAPTYVLVYCEHDKELSEHRVWEADHPLCRFFLDHGCTCIVAPCVDPQTASLGALAKRGWKLPARWGQMRRRVFLETVKALQWAPPPRGEQQEQQEQQQPLLRPLDEVLCGKENVAFHKTMMGAYLASSPDNVAVGGDGGEDRDEDDEEDVDGVFLSTTLGELSKEELLELLSIVMPPTTEANRHTLASYREAYEQEQANLQRWRSAISNKACIAYDNADDADDANEDDVAMQHAEWAAMVTPTASDDSDESDESESRELA
jgi:hypothetical protein